MRISQPRLVGSIFSSNVFIQMVQTIFRKLSYFCLYQQIITEVGNCAMQFLIAELRLRQRRKILRTCDCGLPFLVRIIKQNVPTVTFIVEFMR